MLTDVLSQSNSAWKVTTVGWKVAVPRQVADAQEAGSDAEDAPEHRQLHPRRADSIRCEVVLLPVVVLPWCCCCCCGGNVACGGHAAFDGAAAALLLLWWCCLWWCCLWRPVCWDAATLAAVPGAVVLRPCCGLAGPSLLCYMLCWTRRLSSAILSLISLVHYMHAGCVLCLV